MVAMFLCNLSFIPLVAAAVSIASSASLGNVPENDIASKCPEIFSYVDRSKSGEWIGKLIVQYPEELAGLWIRLLFDSSVSEVVVDDFETVLLEDELNQILIKNRHMKLKAGESITVTMTVKYKGDKVPSIIEYRLNARKLCPDQKMSPEEFFKGDTESADFLSSLLSKRKRISNAQTKCGVRPSNNDLIDPWHASLLVKYGGNEQFLCEGTLIDQYHVLTAAHCVTSSQTGKAIPKRTLSVYLGPRGVSNDEIPANVTELFIHPEYETSSLVNDLAILRLGKAGLINNYVMPICLENGNVPQNEGLVVIGNEKREVEKAFKISTEECVKRAPELRHLLTDEAYCLSYSKDNGKCTGNSGASYVFIKGDVTILQGVVALSVNLQNKKCNENSVVVVTDVSKYSRWIQRIMEAAAAA